MLWVSDCNKRPATSKHQRPTLLNLQLKLRSVKSLNRYREILFHSSFIVLIFCSRLAVSFLLHFHSSFGDGFLSLLAEIIICCLDFLFLIRNVSSFCSETLRCSLLFEKFSPPWRKGFNLSSFESTMRSLCQLYLLSFHTPRNQHIRQSAGWVEKRALKTLRECLQFMQECSGNAPETENFALRFLPVCRLMYTNENFKASSYTSLPPVWKVQLREAFNCNS